jgi:cytochrome P450
MMDHEFIQNPYVAYAMRAKQGDVYWDQNYRSWCVIGYDAICEALTHASFSSDISYFLSTTTFPSKSRDKVKPLVDFFQQWMFYLDPPQHTQLRRKLSPAFSQQSIMGNQTAIKSIIKDVCDACTGEFDFVEQVAKSVAPRVMAHILGVPEADAPQLLQWTLDLTGFLDAFVRGKSEYQPAIKAMHQMQDYFKEDWILNAMLVATGIETTLSFLSSALYTLLSHPSQWALLKSQPKLLDQAIDELLRFEPPVHLNVRSAKEDLSFHGCDIKQGDVISLFLAAANRDARIFERPDQFDITRQNNPHLSFGYGIHYCLGRLLGRLTARVLISYILKHWPHVQLVDTDVTWVMGTSLRRLDALRVRCDTVF